MLVARVEELVPKAEWRKGYGDILFFEHTLAEDHYLIVKFFLHIDKKEQKRRFKALEADPETAWQVEPEDWEHHRKYDEYLVATEEVVPGRLPHASTTGRCP